MDHRKRPRLSGNDENSPPQPFSSRTTNPSNANDALAVVSQPSSASSSPMIKLLQTEIRSLRAELEHSQSMRAIELENARQSEARFKRQLADASEEFDQQNELVKSLRGQIDLHAQKMEDSKRDWLDRIQWYEEQYLESQKAGKVDEVTESPERHKCEMLQKRLAAAMNQVEELSELLKNAEGRVASAEQRASDAELKAMKDIESKPAESEAVNETSKEMLRAQRIKIAETERENRELVRQNDDLKHRLKDMVEYRERTTSSQRQVQRLETELRKLNQQIDEGEEVNRRWVEFRNEIMDEGLIDQNEATLMPQDSHPPEVATVVRKIKELKLKIHHLEEDNSRITQTSESLQRRCKSLETLLNESNQSVSSLEKELEKSKEERSQLEQENRKIVDQQKIWQRESESMRSLVDTYEQQQSSQMKASSAGRSGLRKGSGSNLQNASPSTKGLQLSLTSARDEVKLLTETNKKLESDLESLQAEQQSAKSEHERVLEKFHKLRNALMEERAKAEAAESRACQAETLAGKGSYNSETTMVLHLKSNPSTDAMREKYQKEIDSLKKRLEEAEETITGMRGNALSGAGTTTPASAKGSFGSAPGHAKDEGLSSLDAQKLHKRLKERFKEQIGLFREGVYLITGFKIDMSFSDSDCPRFKVRSIFGETEEDHLMFQWPRNKGSGGKGKEPMAEEQPGLDLLTTDMARLLMNGPSAIYMTKFDSVPAFMASVTLNLFEKQTMV